MARNEKKYVIRTELDTSGVVKKYEQMMKKIRDIDNKHGRGSSPGSPSPTRQRTQERSETVAESRRARRVIRLRDKLDRDEEARKKRREAHTDRVKKAEQDSIKQAEAREKRLRKLAENRLKEEESRRKRLDSHVDRREREAEKRRAREARAASRVPRRNTFQDTQRFHNMNVDAGNVLSRLRAMPTTGVAPELKGEIGALQSRIADIRRSLSRVNSGKELAKLTSDYKEAKRQADKLLRANEKYNNSLSITNQLSSKFVKSLKHAGFALASVYAIGRVGGAMFEVGKDMDAMRASLLAASDNSDIAKQNFEFLRETSFGLGKDIQTMTGGFNRLGVAAKAAGFNTEQIREIFLAGAEASTTFALDNQKTGLVMLAMSQIMSKGKVSLEEISRQLG